MVLCCLWLFSAGILGKPASVVINPSPLPTYGQAEVSEVIQVCADFHLICNIRNYPPVVGEQMPVSIRGLEATGTENDAKVQACLQTLLCKQPKDPNQVILLKNIQRGMSFCLIADVELNGQDLGDFLIKKGLVERILKTPSSEQKPQASSARIAQQPNLLQPIASAAAAVKAGPPPTPGYVSSKGSRIFHRAGCFHVKRIAEEQRIYFQSREEASSGRRPCKTCNP
jgi:hypothetical protein